MRSNCFFWSFLARLGSASQRMRMVLTVVLAWKTKLSNDLLVRLNGVYRWNNETARRTEALKCCCNTTDQVRANAFVGQRMQRRKKSIYIRTSPWEHAFCLLSEHEKCFFKKATCLLQSPRCLLLKRDFTFKLRTKRNKITEKDQVWKLRRQSHPETEKDEMGDLLWVKTKGNG